MFDPLAEAPLIRPEVSLEDAKRVAREAYNLAGEIKELGSNQDRNYLVTPASGPRYLLKFDNDAFSTGEIEVQNKALLLLAGHGVSVPAPIRNTNDEWISSATVSCKPVRTRLLSFIEGSSLVHDGHLFPVVVARLGALAGQVASKLASLKDPALDRDLQWDMRNSMSVIEAYAPYVETGRREAVLKASNSAWPLVQAQAANLPVQAIHGDITDDNVVGQRDELGRVVPSAVIDWGDLSTGWRVAEIAVTVSCIMHHNRSRPLEALPAIKAFDDAVKLSDAELAVLWPLVVLRGAVVVVSSAHLLSLDPENDYIRDRMAHEWHIFDTSAQLPFELAHAAIRAALGRPDSTAPEPDSTLLPDAQFASVRLDTTSQLLNRGVFLESNVEDRLMRAEVARGRVPVLAYGESRLTRTLKPSHNPPATTALCTTLLVKARTEFISPFSGTVTASSDDGKSTVSLQGPFGKIVIVGVKGSRGPSTAGRRIGVVDTRESYAEVTVQWLRPGTENAPKFVEATVLPAWLRLTYDPASLLGLPPADWLEDAALQRERREAAVFGAAEKFFELPPAMERGWRELLYDTTGRGYIDMVNNVAGIGHGHPRMADAVHEQLLTLNTNSRFLYRSLADYIERLRELAPHPSLSAIMLVNSGSEAVDLALKLARAHTGRLDVVALRESYHGWTIATDAISTSTWDNPYAEVTRPAYVHVLDAVNTYRGPHQDNEAGEHYAADAVCLLDLLAAQGKPAGAFICESVFGNGGGITYPDGYLRSVYDAVRGHGGVCIADEVQVGLGRLGHHLWGVQQQNVVPDILTVAKALGNSYPIGAVYTTPEIAASLEREGMFFSSAGGATASAVAGRAVLDIMRDEHLQANAATVGDHVNARLKALAEQHKIIGRVHGMGLYQGVELVRSSESKDPAVEETAWVCERLLDYGVIMQSTSERRNVLKIKPPLTLTIEHADIFVDALDEVLVELDGRLSGSG